MEGTNFEFDKWDRVRLRDTVDPAVYGNYACVGNEGWIADMRKDGRFGLPEVFIKWDKNHWTYNGAPDRWTFQEHFELVQEEEDMPDKDNELFKKFQEFLANGQGESPQPEPKKSTPQFGDNAGGEPSLEAQYSDAIEQVGELLEACESFVIIGVTRRDHPKAEKGMLVPVAVSFAKNPESGLLALSSASQYAAEAHQKLVIDTITAMSEKDE